MNKIPLNIQRFADGKVVIDTDLNEKGFENGLNKIQSIAKTGFKGIATSVGVVATAMTALVGKSVQAAGELEQQVGGAEAVFKSLGKTIEDIKFTSFQDAEGQVMSLKQVANDAYKTMGLSANDYLATINKMGSLMQGSGLDTQKAMDLSAKAMQRAADVASIMGIDVNSAMESIAGAAKGNFTMMDNLGVAMNATTIEAYAMSKGIDKAYTSMTNAEKVELAMEMFLEKSAYAADNYAKENETFAGSFQTLKASIQNFLSGAGDIDSVIDSVMSFGEILVKSIGEMAPKIVEGLIKLVNGVIPEVPKLLKKLLPVVIKGAVDLINGLVNSLPTLLPILIKGIMDAFTAIVKILPQITKSLIDGVLLIIKEIAKQLPTLIPMIIDVAYKMTEAIIDNIDLFIDAAVELIVGLAEGLIKALPKLIEKVPILIEKLVTKLTDPEMLGKIVQAAAKLITELAIALVMSIPSLLKGVKKINDAIINGLWNIIQSVGEIGINIAKGIWSGLSNSLSWIKDKIKGWVGNITKFIKKLFGIHSPSTVMRDEVGKYLAQGLGVGFDDELDNVYRDMQKSINFENAKIQASVESGKVFNSLVNTTPISISLDGSVEMDSQRVGRIITPVVSKTIKTGGGY